MERCDDTAYSQRVLLSEFFGRSGPSLTKALPLRGFMSRRNGNRSQFHINLKRRLALRARMRAALAKLIAQKAAA